MKTSILKKLSLAFVFLCIVAAVISYWLVISTRANLNAIKKSVAESGQITEITDYPLPVLSDDQNAFIILSELSKELEQIEGKLSKIDDEPGIYGFVDGEQVSKEALAQVAQRLPKYDTVFDSLAKASDLAGFRSNFDPTQGFAAELPHLGMIRSTCRTLSVKAILDAHEGRGDAALETCGTILRISKLSENEPLLISHLVSVACQTISLSTTNHILQVAEVSEAAIDRFLQQLDQLNVYESLVAAVEAERAMGILTFQQLRSGSLGEDFTQHLPGPASIGNNWLTEAYLNDDEATYVKIMSQQLSVINEPKSIRDLKIEESLEPLEDSSSRFVVSKLILPALSGAIDSADRLEAMIRCVRIVTVATKLKTTSIDDLTLPESKTLDPFNQLPLVVKATESGWLVYSVGQNLVDDGGAFQSKLDIGIGPLTESGVKPGE